MRPQIHRHVVEVVWLFEPQSTSDVLQWPDSLPLSRLVALPVGALDLQEKVPQLWWLVVRHDQATRPPTSLVARPKDLRDIPRT